MTDRAPNLFPLTLALWATNLAVPVNGLDGWVTRVEAKLAEAANAGAGLMLMPEYACEQWLSFKPEGLDPAEEIPWMAERAPEALARLRPLVARYDVALLAGTMPWPVDGGYRNRAWLLLPDGREIAQDKLVLTPGEMEPEAWNMATGDELTIVEWRGLRIATLICLDVEVASLSAMLTAQEVDLVLVPSMTSALSGCSRVLNCAAARAVELMTVVACAGCVGAASGTTQNPTNVGACAIRVPCEPGLGHIGVLAATEPAGEDDGDGPFLIARDLPIGEIRDLRAGTAEVWPGAWDAGKVQIGKA